MLVGVISDQKTVHNISHRVSCRALGVSEVWFHKWRRRPDEPTKREIRRGELAERVRYFFDRSGNTYGSSRITLDLWRRVGKYRRAPSPRSWPNSVCRAADRHADAGR